ncbi:DUF4136 domain-containing protein [Aquiflexum sp.]|uniref:DUF4136 domain-containing protein n=1 Tax=Aquiflexum sp. TaxID=1872584 RepID=UPI003593D834
MKSCFYLIIYFLIIVFTNACVPDGPDAIDVLDLVYTNFDPSYDFGTPATYSMPENVILIDRETVENPGTTPPFADFIISQAILDRIRSNMTARGYIQVNEFNDPDLIILPSITDGNRVFYEYDWWFWGWYYPDFSPVWDWVYPGYLPAAITSVETGTVLIQMTNPKELTSENQIPVHWISVINGIVSGSTGDNANRIVRTIDQAFVQSPYLTR